MNFLAHIFLSGGENDIMLGNFMGDYVKGKDYQKYPDGIRKGIILHRAIDSFTDTHPVVHRSKTHLNARYHKFSGIIVDIFFDHFLCVEWERYASVPLQEYIHNFYRLAADNFSKFPPLVKRFLPFFIINNWLESYQTVEGIESVLYRMSQRTSLPGEAQYAIHELVREYDSFRQEFLEFFPSLQSYVELRLNPEKAES